MAQPLLSDLCSLCHSQVPKYRCPRCKTQTCSLPCYKRHQQRAACSGKRDPAAYVKKNDLATPTGVDRDYNYLKGVERMIEDAARTTVSREDALESNPSRLARASRQPNSSLSKYLERNSITVQYAPEGMSRQKTNQTRISKSGKALWTVEWVRDDGQGDIKDDCEGSATLAELYGAIQSARGKAERRRLEKEREGKGQSKQKRGLKRKREQNLEASQQNLDDATIQNETEFLQNLKSDDEPTTTVTGTNENQEASSDPIHIITEAEHNQASTGPSTSNVLPPESQNEAHSPIEHHYYLLKPMTVGFERVVIPLNPDASLSDSLQRQTVLEYPTIYVLAKAPNELHSGFILEANYLENMAKISKDQTDASNIISHAHSNRPTQEEETKADAELDAKSILSMLKRDIAL